MQTESSLQIASVPLSEPHYLFWCDTSLQGEGFVIQAYPSTRTLNLSYCRLSNIHQAFAWNKSGYWNCPLDYPGPPLNLKSCSKSMTSVTNPANTWGWLKNMTPRKLRQVEIAGDVDNKFRAIAGPWPEPHMTIPRGGDAPQSPLHFPCRPKNNCSYRRLLLIRRVHMHTHGIMQYHAATVVCP